MLRVDVIDLIGEAPEAHGVFDTVTETKTQVWCTIRSVTRSEYYQAKSAGIEPQVVFRLEADFDYHGEKIVEWNGHRYRVIRAYFGTQDWIELTCELATNDREAIT